MLLGVYLHIKHMVEQIHYGSFTCQIDSCHLTFTAGTLSPTDIEVARSQAEYHERQNHVGITRVEGTELFRAVSVTVYGHEFLTGPLPQSLARSRVAESVGDKAPEYFLNNSNENGQKN